MIIGRKTCAVGYDMELVVLLARQSLLPKILVDVAEPSALLVILQLLIVGFVL